MGEDMYDMDFETDYVLNIGRTCLGNSDSPVTVVLTESDTLFYSEDGMDAVAAALIDITKTDRLTAEDVSIKANSSFIRSKDVTYRFELDKSPMYRARDEDGDIGIGGDFLEAIYNTSKGYEILLSKE